MPIDFNDVESQNFEVIPTGTILPVRMKIKPGGYSDATRGWDDGYATCNKITGTVYLACEFTVLGGEYIKRKVSSMIGLHSPSGEKWEHMGKSFIRTILNSAYGLTDEDNSPQAHEKRRINSLGDLDGIEFVAKVGVSTDEKGNDWNEIKNAIMANNNRYTEQAQYLGNNPSQPMAHNAVVAPAGVAETPYWLK